MPIVSLFPNPVGFHFDLIDLKFTARHASDLQIVLNL